MGILFFVLKYMYIFLLLKMINGFFWPAKIMASPFKFIEMWFLIAGLVNQTWDQQKYCMMLFESLTMQTFI